MSMAGFLLAMETILGSCDVKDRPLKDCSQIVHVLHV